MATYKDISLLDFESAKRCLEIKDYRIAAYLFQQFAEKGAKVLLAAKDPHHKQMKSRLVEEILKAYDIQRAASDISIKAKYLSGFYFNTRYPGDNYEEIVQAQAEKAYEFAKEIRAFYEAEMALISNETAEPIV